MLNIDTLQQKIQEPLEIYLNRALATAMNNFFPVASEQAEKIAQAFADDVTECCAESIAEALAGAIDYYVRSITIFGTINTTGTSASQVAVINSPNAATNGKIPNSLGIM